MRERTLAEYVSEEGEAVRVSFAHGWREAIAQEYRTCREPEAEFGEVLPSGRTRYSRLVDVGVRIRQKEVRVYVNGEMYGVVELEDDSSLPELDEAVRSRVEADEMLRYVEECQNT